MRNFLPALLALLISACAGGPPVPDWKKDSVSLIEKYKKAELSGENKLADHYFEQALAAAGSAARIEETAKLHLIRCATRQASLVFETCNGFLDLSRLGTNIDDETYYRFISGQRDQIDAGKLPAQYRDFFKNSDATKAVSAIQKIEDPLSRLIAISITVMHKQSDDGILNLAAETSSEQGWRKPLLVYLKLLESRASQKGDNTAVERLRTRIKLVESSL